MSNKTFPAWMEFASRKNATLCEKEIAAMYGAERVRRSDRKVSFNCSSVEDAKAIARAYRSAIEGHGWTTTEAEKEVATAINSASNCDQPEAIPALPSTSMMRWMKKAHKLTVTQNGSHRGGSCSCGWRFSGWTEKTNEVRLSHEEHVIDLWQRRYAPKS